MADNKILRALPSKVILSAGHTLQFDTLSGSQATQIRRQLCQNAGRRMSGYYSAHPKSWKIFLECMAD
ncbi:hypothetical protein MCG98_14570 [Ruminococcus sp. OA3]|uniref:hypothetical protein n=1 Tax=Ruminococcus sp. OA3 TaxID=2914164 RepID=UPI001F0545D2|nr:hypothetical protein [Ruminococcus sp. OA3]MCH1983794.1 hypothetical protein [Ruminococcus sp. OA3]